MTCRVLVVASDEVLLTVIAGLLVDRGADVSCVTGIESMLEAVQVDRPDVVVIDMGTTEPNGRTKFFGTLRRDPRGVKVRTVLVSPVGAPARRRIPDPLDVWITKPFDTNELGDAVFGNSWRGL